MTVGHEALLEAAMRELRRQGFRLIRLDRRAVPDAIAFKGQDVIAVEADTSPTSVWLTRRKFESGQSQYDAEIIVTKPFSDHYHSWREYHAAIDLRKEGLSYKAIQRTLKERFGRHVPLSLINGWIKGKTKPITEPVDESDKHSDTETAPSQPD